MPQVSSASEALNQMEEHFAASKAAGIKGSVQLQLTGQGGGTWAIEISDAKFDLVEGGVASPTTTLTMSAEDFVGLVNGDLNAMAAFMQGRIKLQGDMSLAMRFQTIFGIA
jgi:putative sterol carrier protein